MKIIIAAAASLAIAGSALAAVPCAEQKPSLKTVGQVDLAWGPNRSANKAPSTGKYSNGKTFG